MLNRHRDACQWHRVARIGAPLLTHQGHVAASDSGHRRVADLKRLGMEQEDITDDDIEGRLDTTEAVLPTNQVGAFPFRQSLTGNRTGRFIEGQATR